MNPGYLSDDCRYGWHRQTLENEGTGCLGYEPGYAEFPAITCTCKCHNEKEED